LIVGDPVDAVDHDVAADPARRVQLGRRLQGALADHAKIARSTPERPRLAPATRAIALPTPAAPKARRPRAGARLRRRQEVEAVRRAHARRLLATEEALDRAHKPNQRLAIKQVLTAEIVDHHRDRTPRSLRSLCASARYKISAAASCPPSVRHDPGRAALIAELRVEIDAVAAVRPGA
jgi:hypothetical protein